MTCQVRGCLQRIHQLRVVKVASESKMRQEVGVMVTALGRKWEGKNANGKAKGEQDHSRGWGYSKGS